MSAITSIEINKKKMSAGLIPSTKYIDLEVPTITDGSGSKDFDYIALEDGFYYILFVANNYDGTNVGCSISNRTRNFRSRSSILNPYDNHTGFIQCLKGDQIRINFQSHVKVDEFKFIYAIGSEPKEE